MEISDFMKIFASGRRMEVLEALVKGEKKTEIKSRVPASTYAFTFDYLKKVGFAEEAGGDISLTPSGHAHLVIFGHFIRSISTLQRIYQGFSDHIIFFPNEFLIRLFEIDDFELVVSEPSDVLKPHRVFFENLKKSKDIKGVSPLMFPDYPEMFKNLAGGENSISLVVSDEVLKIISEYPIKEYSNIAIYQAREMPEIAVTVTDYFLSIGFFYKSGSYDFTRDLMSRSPAAIEFGRDLVNYYEKRSRRIA